MRSVLLSMLVASLLTCASAELWDCTSQTNCYGCLQADITCTWCPTSKVCSANFPLCNVTRLSNGDQSECPCTDAARSDCWSCSEGTMCSWCHEDGVSSCVNELSCTNSGEICPDLKGLAKWLIAVIIVGSILVVLIPIIIIVICCCCVVGTAAAAGAAASSERSSLVHHHNSASSATVIYSQPGYAAPPPAAYPSPTYQ